VALVEVETLNLLGGEQSVLLYAVEHLVVAPYEVVLERCET
jgi:hypothetical protein